jgi:glycosyltransferase involved in cell wall biosynthesis
MNVLHVIQRYPPALGGAEAWCRGLARWQVARGDAVTVLTCRATTDDQLWSDPPHHAGACAVGSSDVDGGVQVVRCAVAAPFGPAGQRLCERLHVPMLARAHSPELYGHLLRRARAVDVVHAHAVPGPHVFAAWIAARVARRPFVLTPLFHAGDVEHESRAVRRLIRAADALVAITAAEVHALTGRGVDSARVILATNALDDLPPVPPAADIRATLGVARDRALLVFLGRKGPTKGLGILLEALAHLRHTPPPLLVLAGPSTEWWRACLSGHPAAPVVDLPPLSESTKAALLAACDLLVLPSRHESFGGVFLEAWRAGTPVVGADIPSVREVIGDAGWLFRPDDAVDLARRIDDVLADPDGRRASVRRARARLENEFTWARVGAAVEAAYERALAPRTAPRAASARRVSC